MFEFLLQYKFIIIFYLFVIAFLILKRKKIDVQGKIIFLYRMKFGLKWMDKYAKKHREWVILLGYIGVGAGFIGLLFISFYLVKNLIDFLTTETLVQGASIVYPGMTVPGLGVLPFWDWIIAIFFIAAIHEFSHGIVARAHNIPVKNTGLVFFGPILGAFVEPDEKIMAKKSDIQQYSVLAAGSFSNIILALVALLILNLAFMPLQASMTDNIGFTFDAYVEGSYPFQEAGIATGTLVTGINGEPTTNFQTFAEELQFHRPEDKITVNTIEKDYEITLATNPDNDKKPFLGINQIRNEVEKKSSVNAFSYWIITRLASFLRWLFLLSFGIGVFNLLPLPIVDGGRMTQVFLQKLKGTLKGNQFYAKISLFFLLVLLLNLVYPFLQKLL